MTTARRSPFVTAASAVRAAVVNQTLSSPFAMACATLVLVPQSVPLGAPEEIVSSLTSTVAPVVTVLVPNPTLRMFPVLGISIRNAAFSPDASRRMLP